MAKTAKMERRSLLLLSSDKQWRPLAIKGRQQEKDRQACSGHWTSHDNHSKKGKRQEKELVVVIIRLATVPGKVVVSFWLISPWHRRLLLQQQRMQQTNSVNSFQRRWPWHSTGTVSTQKIVGSS